MKLKSFLSRTFHRVAFSVMILGIFTFPSFGALPQADKQAPVQTVTVNASGVDVRTALSDLFNQAKQSFVLQPSIKFNLWLSLNNVDFDEALGIICNQAHLKYEKQNGIWYVSVITNGQPTTAPVPTKTEPKPTPEKVPTQPKPTPNSNPKPVVEPTKTPSAPITYGQQDLYKIVSTKFYKTGIRTVFESLSKQTKIPIFLDSSIPNYKLDVILLKTSIRYALNKIDTAAGLIFTIEPNGIKVTLANSKHENVVSVIP